MGADHETFSRRVLRASGPPGLSGLSARPVPGVAIVLPLRAVQLHRQGDCLAFYFGCSFVVVVVYYLLAELAEQSKGLGFNLVTSKKC